MEKEIRHLREMLIAKSVELGELETKLEILKRENNNLLLYLSTLVGLLDASKRNEREERIYLLTKKMCELYE